jgi:hypothetical protein
LPFLKPIDRICQIPILNLLDNLDEFFPVYYKSQVNTLNLLNSLSL